MGFRPRAVRFFAWFRSAHRSLHGHFSGQHVADVRETLLRHLGRDAALAWGWKRFAALRNVGRQLAGSDSLDRIVERCLPAAFDRRVGVRAKIAADLDRCPIHGRGAPFVIAGFALAHLLDGLDEGALVVECRAADLQELGQSRRPVASPAGSNAAGDLVWRIPGQLLRPNGFHALDVAAAPEVGDLRAVEGGKALEDALNPRGRQRLG